MYRCPGARPRRAKVCRTATAQGKGQPGHDSLHPAFNQSGCDTAPAAGYRWGTSVNNVGNNGNYWSSTPNNTNNAYNMNFNDNNANMNNNNRNNGQSVRLVRDVADCPPLLTDLFAAYRSARRHKRNTRGQLEFELDLERNVVELSQELSARSYRPGSCVCFVVEDPVKREVFASSFKDRVVHHLYYNYLSPLFERSFIYDSYSCRKGKGTLKGVERLEHHLRSATDNYKKRAWVLKLDLQGYFMSIDRARLNDAVKASIEKYWDRKPGQRERQGGWPTKDFVVWLTEVIIGRDPLEGCRMKGRATDWAGLPRTKSLRWAPPGVGLPIGDLTSQLFSNIFLTRMDQYVKRELGFKHYGRYVDDFYIVDESHSRLKEAVGEVGRFVSGMGLRVHPKKTTLQDTWRSQLFLGAVVYPHQRYCRSRTVNNFRKRMSGCSGRGEPYPSKQVVDSYKGLMSHYKAFRLTNMILAGKGD